MDECGGADDVVMFLFLSIMLARTQSNGEIIKQVALHIFTSSLTALDAVEAFLQTVQSKPHPSVARRQRSVKGRSYQVVMDQRLRLATILRFSPSRGVRRRAEAYCPCNRDSPFVLRQEVKS
mmetsp:Transcript_1091/g.3421  ORF Transcript_1091/g.3421 Transcript_1091/m.3421 type:complete len:122 (+) Transcript_1091:85-450(+)